MFFPLPPNGVNGMLAANEAGHSRERRLVSHAFSDKALQAQEHIIQQYVDLRVQRLHEQVKGESYNKIDIVRWYNHTTFDVIADLAFGESFHCLRDKDYHPWVPMVFQTVKSFGIISIKRYFPFRAKIINMFETQAALDFRREFFAFVDKKIATRLSMEMTRPDFMSFIMRHQDEKGMTLKEIESTLNGFMLAGSETSATALLSTTLFLVKHPHTLKKLVEEVRGRSKSESEITLEKVNKLRYLIAVLNESLRLYPPVPTGFPRVVPHGGDVISGYWVPEKVRHSKDLDYRKT